MPGKLSVVLITYNLREVVAHALRSVLQQTQSVDYELIVIDNASQDGTPGAVASEFPEAELVENSENIGFARAVNQAVRMAQGDYIVLLNSDCFLRNDAFGQMAAYLDSHYEVGIVGAKLLNESLTVQPSCRRFVSWQNELLAFLPLLYKLPLQCFHRDLLPALTATEPLPADYVSGACFMFRRRTFEQMGGFDERFFMYSEEEDFCYRAQSAGWKTVYLPAAEAIHLGSQSFGAQSFRRCWLVAHSRLNYYRKHHGFYQVLWFRGVLCLASLLRLPFAVLGYLVVSKRPKARDYAVESVASLKAYLGQAGSTSDARPTFARDTLSHQSE